MLYHGNQVTYPSRVYIRSSELKEKRNGTTKLSRKNKVAKGSREPGQRPPSPHHHIHHALLRKMFHLHHYALMGMSLTRPRSYRVNRGTATGDAEGIRDLGNPKHYISYDIKMTLASIAGHRGQIAHFDMHLYVFQAIRGISINNIIQITHQS